MNITHILNGDAIMKTFEESGVPGEVFVWRLMLCEGPTTFKVGSVEFWAKRIQFMSETYGVDPSRYRTKSITELKKLRNTHCEEVVLWFEYDLFCQINMLAAIQYVSEHLPKSKISVVCPDPKFEEGPAVTLGHISATDFRHEFDNRVTLDEEDLVLAQRVWHAYNEKDPGSFEGLNLKTKTFPHLSLALQAHLQRFPDPMCGLNKLQFATLTAVYDKEMNERELVGAMLSSDVPYGFGDLQWQRIVKELKRYFLEGSTFSLSEDGRAIVSGMATAIPDMVTEERVGGALLNDYWWSSEEQRLLNRKK